jgi:hypothetical protein
VAVPYALCGERPETLEEWDRHVLVDVIHDGAHIPPLLEHLLGSNGALDPRVHAAYLRERDWGAAAVAERLAFHLGLRGYQSKQSARVLCDYNRFRGRTQPGSGHLGRRALFPPVSDLLPLDAQEQILADCYDATSKGLFDRAREAFEGTLIRDSRLLRVTVHTYDDRAGEGNRRPKTSLIFTPFEYHEFARLPTNVYAPVFPDRLAEFTADRTLAYRMALLLEKNYLPVAVNSPYFLPLGGAEMRLQVWCYMKHLREQVGILGTDTEIERLAPLWPVLESVDEPWGARVIEPDHLALLHELTQFIERNRFETVERYRYSAYRPNAIEVEVRKDVIWAGSWQRLEDGFDAFVPDEDGIRLDEVDRVASVMAEGIRTYLTQDQPEKRRKARRQ